MKPDENHQLANLQTCLKDIKNWFSHNLLLLKSDKTQVIVMGLKQIGESLNSYNILHLDSISSAFSTTVRNMGIIFDHDLCFNLYVKHISRMSFFHLCNIAKVSYSFKTGCKETSSCICYFQAELL